MAAPASNILKAVFFTIISVFGFWSNLTFAYSLAVRRKRLLKAECIFLASLAVSDLLISTVVLPIQIAESLAIMIPNAAQDIFRVLSVVILFSKMWNLALITLQRFMTLHMPLRFSEVTSSSSPNWLLIALVWIISILWSSVPFIAPSVQADGNSVTHSLICASTKYIIVSGVVFVIIPLVVSIIFTVLTKVRQLNRNKTIFTAIIMNNERRRHGSVLAGNRKVARGTIAITTTFIACYFPIFTLGILSLSRVDVSVFSLTVMESLMYFNSVLNPLANLYHNEELWEAVKAKFCCGIRHSVITPLRSSGKEI